MADAKIGRAVLEIVVDDKEYKLALEGIDKNTEETAKSVGNISSLLNAGAFVEFAKVAGEAILSVGEAILSLGERGAGVSSVAESFAQLSARAGESADVMLGELREGVAGTMSDFELMKLANQSLGSGLVTSSKDMRTLAEGARLLANATGGTLSQAYDKLTDAMSTGKTASLKQLGVFVDSKVALQDYSAAINKNVKDFTDQDRAAAMTQASLAALRDRLKDLPPAAKDFGEMIAAAKASVSNFVDQLSVGIAQSPVFQVGMSRMGSAIQEAFGPHQTEIIDFLVRSIENVAIFAMDVAHVVVEAARLMGNGFLGLKVLFNEFLAGVFHGLDDLALGIKKVAESAASLPGVGKMFAGVADEMTSVHDFANSMAMGFDQMKESALDSAAALNENFDKVQGVIGKTKDAMVTAQAQAGQTQAVVKQTMAVIGEGADHAAARSVESSQKIAAAFQDLNYAIEIGTKEGLDKRLAELEAGAQRELEQLSQLKGLTEAEYAQLVDLVVAKYTQMTEAAILGGDAIRDRHVQLQQEIALAEATGTQQRLMQIEFARQKEIESVAFLSANYATTYEALVALINEKYAQMTAAATGHGQSAEQAAAAAGFKTRAELEATAARAIETYQKMKESGLFTTAQLKEAHEKAEEAKREATGKTQAFNMTAGQAFLTGTTQVLDVLGQKHKTAAIAGAIIATYAAVAKALASAPWPANLALAAGALAAGMANVNRIRSSNPGYREGTPNLDFADFGSVSMQALHGREAVVPAGKGHLLAGEIAAAMPGPDNMALDRLGVIAAGIEDLPRAIRRAFLGALQATT